MDDRDRGVSRSCVRAFRFHLFAGSSLPDFARTPSGVARLWTHAHVGRQHQPLCNIVTFRGSTVHDVALISSESIVSRSLFLIRSLVWDHHSQLALVDTTLTLIVAIVSSTVVLSPVAEVLSRMFGPAIFWTTSAIILWAMIALVISLFPKLWLWSYVVGVSFYALPFRLGRRLGAYLMASSIVVAVALPILPNLALQFQGFIGYEGSFRGLEDLASQIQTNPLAIPTIIASLPQTMATLMAAVIISLIVFPVAYLFALSLVVRSAVNLIGGGSSLVPTSSFFLGPSKQLAGELAD